MESKAVTESHVPIRMLGTFAAIAVAAVVAVASESSENSRFWITIVGFSAVLGGCWFVLSWAFGIVSMPTAVVWYFFFYFVVVPSAQQIVGVIDYDQETKSGWHYAGLGILTFTLGAVVAKVLGLRRKTVEQPVLAERFEFLYRPVVILVPLVIGAIANVTLWRMGLTNENETSGIAGLIGSASKFLDIAITGSAALWFVKRSRIALYLLVASVTTAVLHGFLSESKGMMLVPVVEVMLVRIVARQQLPLVLPIALGFAYFFVVAPLVVTMRTERHSTSVSTEAEFVQHASKSLNISEFGTSNTRQFYDILRTLDRAGPRMLGTIVETTGSMTPFDNGSTYVWAMETMVPRALWPGKPPMNVGNYVGHKYLILADEDEITGVSPGLIGEMYMNFGSVGVLLGMALLGVVTTVIQQSLLVYVGSAGIAFYFIGFLFSQESPVAHCAVPGVKGLVVLLVGLWGLKGLFGRTLKRS